MAGLAVVAATALVGCGSIQKPEGWSSPVLLGDAVLLQARTGQLSLVNATTGATRWQYPADDHSDRPFYATPVVDGSAVFVVDYKGKVTRIETGGGQPVEAWSEEVGQQVVATPLLLDGMLYVPTEDGHVVVLGEDGGIQRRVSTTDRRIWGAPAGASGTVYVADLDDGSALAFSAGTGDHIWETEDPAPTAADLVLAGGTLFVGSFDRHLHALNASDGEELWSAEGDGWFLARPLVDGDLVYGVTMRGSVYAFDRVTGQQRWEYQLTDAEFRSTPVLVKGSLVVGARDGRIAVLDAETGAETSLHDVEIEGVFNANPLAVDDVVYFMTSKHDLYAVDVAGKTVRSIPVTAQ